MSVIKYTFSSIDDLIKFNQSIYNIQSKDFYDITLKDNKIQTLNLNISFNGCLNLYCDRLYNIEGNFNIGQLKIEYMKIFNVNSLVINLNTNINILTIINNGFNFNSLIIKGDFLKLTNINFNIRNNCLIDISYLNINEIYPIIINDLHKLYYKYFINEFQLSSFKSDIKIEDTKDIIYSFYYPNLKYISNVNKSLIGYFDRDLNIKEDIIEELKLYGIFSKINGKIETLKLSKLKLIDITSDLQFYNLVFEKDFIINDFLIKCINASINKNKNNLKSITFYNYFPINIDFIINTLYYINVSNVKSINNVNNLICSYDNEEKKENNIIIDDLKGNINKLEIYYEYVNIRNYDVNINELHLYKCKKFILIKQNIKKFNVKKIFIHKDELTFTQFINLVKLFMYKNIELYFNDKQYIYDFNNDITLNYKECYIYNNDKQTDRIININCNNSEKITINGSSNEIILNGSVDELYLNDINFEKLDISNIKVNKIVKILGNNSNLKEIICNPLNKSDLLINSKSINKDLIIHNANSILINNNKLDFIGFQKFNHLIFYIDKMSYMFYINKSYKNIYNNDNIEFNINDFPIFYHLNLNCITINKDYDKVLIKGDYKTLNYIIIDDGIVINNLELNGNFKNYIEIAIKDNSKKYNIVNLKFSGSYNRLIFKNYSHIKNMIYENFEFNNAANTLNIVCPNTIFLDNVNIEYLIINYNSYSLLLQGNFEKVLNIYLYYNKSKFYPFNNSIDIILDGNFSNLRKIIDEVNIGMDDTIIFNSLILNNTTINNDLQIINYHHYIRYKYLKLSGYYKNVIIDEHINNRIYENYYGDNIKLFGNIYFLDNVNITDFNNIVIDKNYKYILTGTFNVSNCEIEFKDKIDEQIFNLLKHINKINKLYFYNIKNIDFKIDLNDIDELYFDSCCIKNIPDNLYNLKSLKLYNCPYVKEIPLTLMNLQTLELVKTNIIYINLLFYSNLKNIILKGIKNIDNLDISKLQSFSISSY